MVSVTLDGVSPLQTLFSPYDLPLAPLGECGQAREGTVDLHRDVASDSPPPDLFSSRPRDLGKLGCELEQLSISFLLLRLKRVGHITKTNDCYCNNGRT
jgi:hypothetical protein